eukprot:766820-Hanusia_phi.AAC.1
MCLGQAWSVCFQLKLPSLSGDICQTLRHRRTTGRSSTLAAGANVVIQETSLARNEFSSDDVVLQQQKNNTKVGTVIETCGEYSLVTIDEQRQRWYRTTSLCMRQESAEDSSSQVGNYENAWHRKCERFVSLRGSKPNESDSWFEVGRVILEISKVVEVEWSANMRSFHRREDLDLLDEHEVRREIDSLVCIHEGYLGCRFHGKFYPALPGIDLNLLGHGAHDIHVRKVPGEVQFLVDQVLVGRSRYPGPCAISSFGNVLQASPEHPQTYRRVCAACGNCCQCEVEGCRNPGRHGLTWSFFDVHVFEEDLCVKEEGRKHPLLTLAHANYERMTLCMPLTLDDFVDQADKVGSSKVRAGSILQMLRHEPHLVEKMMESSSSDILQGIDLTVSMTFCQVTASIGAQLMLASLLSTKKIFDQLSRSLVPRIDWNEEVKCLDKREHIGLLLIRSVFNVPPPSNLESVNSEYDSKIEEKIPSNWSEGFDYQFDASNIFCHGEVCLVKRSDGSIRFARVRQVKAETATDPMSANTIRYDLDVSRDGRIIRDNQKAGDHMAKILTKRARASYVMIEDVLQLLRAHSIKVSCCDCFTLVEILKKFEANSNEQFTTLLELLQEVKLTASLLTWIVCKILDECETSSNFGSIKHFLTSITKIKFSDRKEEIIKRLVSCQFLKQFSIDLNNPYPKQKESFYTESCGEVLASRIFKSCLSFYYNGASLLLPKDVNWMMFRRTWTVSSAATRVLVKVLHPSPDPSRLKRRNSPWLHLAWTPPRFLPALEPRQQRRRMYARGFAYCPSKGL